MRLLVPILFLILSFETFAGCKNFIPISEATKAIAGESMAGAKSCKDLPNEQCLCYDKIVWQSAKLDDVMIDDMSKPKFLKGDLESCLDDADCQTKLEALDCADGVEAVKVLDTDPKEVYCKVPNGFEKMASGSKKLSTDAQKMSDFIVARAAEKAELVAVETQISHMEFGKRLYASVLLLNKGKGLSKAQKRQMRNDLKEIRKDLYDGSICAAREDIAALTPDGVVIRAQDITAVLSKIDSFLTCN